ncbi:MAG: hypothetical protein ACLUNZ_05150 [Evtepia sp.]
MGLEQSKEHFTWALKSCRSWYPGVSPGCAEVHPRWTWAWSTAAEGLRGGPDELRAGAAVGVICQPSAGAPSTHMRQRGRSEREIRGPSWP